MKLNILIENVIRHLITRLRLQPMIFENIANQFDHISIELDPKSNNLEILYHFEYSFNTAKKIRNFIAYLDSMYPGVMDQFIIEGKKANVETFEVVSEGKNNLLSDIKLINKNNDNSVTLKLIASLLEKALSEEDNLCILTFKQNSRFIDMHPNYEKVRNFMINALDEINASIDEINASINDVGISAFGRGAALGGFRSSDNFAIPDNVSVEIAAYLDTKDLKSLGSVNKEANNTAQETRREALETLGQTHNVDTAYQPTLFTFNQKDYFKTEIKKLIEEIITDRNAVDLLTACLTSLNAAIRKLNDKQYSPNIFDPTKKGFNKVLNDNSVKDHNAKIYDAVIKLASLLNGSENSQTRELWAKINCTTQERRVEMSAKGKELVSQYLQNNFDSSCNPTIY